MHSTFQPVENPDYVLPVEVNGVEHQVYVLKRPHVDEFLEKIGQLYECVLFTASLKHYADQVANLLDKSSDVFKARLFRDSCLFQNGYYIKDLSKLGRDLERVVILDNCPASYLMHPVSALYFIVSGFTIYFKITIVIYNFRKMLSLCKAGLMTRMIINCCR